MTKTSSEKIPGRSKSKPDTKTVRASSKKSAKKNNSKTSIKKKASDSGKVSPKARIKKEEGSAKAPARDLAKKTGRKSVPKKEGKSAGSGIRASGDVPKKGSAGRAAAGVDKEKKQKVVKAAARARELPVGRAKGPVTKRAAESRKTKTKAGVKQKTGAMAEETLKSPSRKAARKMTTGRVAGKPGGRIGKGIKEGRKSGSSATKEYQAATHEKFPVEYGENEVTLMPVDPRKLFVFWEVREDAMEPGDGDLTIRVYDVAGGEFKPAEAGSYFDVAAGDRMGKRYIEVSPGREFIADIGIRHGGSFVAFARSPRVSTPRAGVSPPGDLPRKPSKEDVRVGY